MQHDCSLLEGSFTWTQVAIVIRRVCRTGRRGKAAQAVAARAGSTDLARSDQAFGQASEMYVKFLSCVGVAGGIARR